MFEFLKALAIATEDQPEMFPPVEIDGDDPAAGAADGRAMTSRAGLASQAPARGLPDETSAILPGCNKPC